MVLSIDYSIFLFFIPNHLFTSTKMMIKYYTGSLYIFEKQNLIKYQYFCVPTSFV